MQILSYALSLLGLLSMILASLTKGERMKTILFLVFCGNVLVATSYLVGGSGINGAAACYLGALQTLINYFFDSKNKPLPKWLITSYAIAIIVLNIWVAGGVTALGLLVIVASLTFILCIGQKNGAKYRFWTLVNMLLWCTYDILSATYSVLVTHAIQLAFAFIGMIIHDKKTKKS
ncbi:MAG: YgjV family protein [Clostridia bacterium]|nr:YgjV family protein [Clostridia bacterium]